MDKSLSKRRVKVHLKKRWICIVSLFVLFPVTAYAQTGLYELPQGRMAVGLGFTGVDFSRGQDAIGIGASLSYGINNRTKIALVTNVGIIDEERYFGSELDIPLPVAIGVGPVHVGSLGQTGLDYFLAGTFYRGFSSGISRRLDDPTNERLLSVRTNGLAGGGGISKRIQTNFGWTLNPFCGVSYSRSWTHISTKGALEETGHNRISSGFGGRAGLEVEVSPTISVIGAFGVSFKNIDGSFSIGLNFH